MKHLQRAIAILGGQLQLAKACGVGQSNVSMWKRRGNIPAEMCPLIERATGGLVKCEQLRPDVAWEVLRNAA